MPLKRILLISAALWIAGVSLFHGFLNLGWRISRADGEAAEREPFRIGFLPVTCHLTCPVTHFINKNLEGDGGFTPMRFHGWTELKEAFLSGHTEATFILAPMAMMLREQGTPIKIVYLGHRDGTAVMVHKDSDIRRTADLKGKTIAVPNRYSNQRLLVHRSLKDVGLSLDDVNIVEMPPPDMPAALATKSVDAISSGEPFMGQTELDGYGRVLWLTKDVWPNFISCVLAVHEDVIENRRDEVQRLVDGIAKSGKWIDQSMDHRMQTSQFVAKNYYHQHPRLLEFVLSKPPDRVTYSNLNLVRPQFEEIEQLAREIGILQGTAHFEDYCDPSFVTPENMPPYVWEYTALEPNTR